VRLTTLPTTNTSGLSAICSDAKTFDQVDAQGPQAGHSWADRRQRHNPSPGGPPRGPAPPVRP
jgi:hypothetical protein